MGELSKRVQEVAETTAGADAALTPRAAAKVERQRAAEAARAQRAANIAADQAETARRCGLAQILDEFRSVADDAGDVGTVGYARLKRFKDRRIRLGRRPRGWQVAAMSVPIQFQDGVRTSVAQLVLCVDGRLYAGMDGTLGDSYQLGQVNPPITTWMLTPEIWRMLEDTIPETIGHLVGALDLEWPDD